MIPNEYFGVANYARAMDERKLSQFDSATFSNVEHRPKVSRCAPANLHSRRQPAAKKLETERGLHIGRFIHHDILRDRAGKPIPGQGALYFALHATSPITWAGLPNTRA